jgi:hypothetical protein
MSTCARWAASLFRARLPDSAHLKDQQKAVATLKEIVSRPGCSRIPGFMIDSFEPHFNLKPYSGIQYPACRTSSTLQKEQNDMNDMYMISVLMYVLMYCKTLILCSCRMLVVPLQRADFVLLHGTVEIFIRHSTFIVSHKIHCHLCPL